MNGTIVQQSNTMNGLIGISIAVIVIAVVAFVLTFVKKRRIPLPMVIAFLLAFVVLLGCTVFFKTTYSANVQEKIHKDSNISEMSIDKSIPECSTRFSGYLSAASWKMKSSGSQKVGLLVGTKESDGTCRFQLKNIGEGG